METETLLKVHCLKNSDSVLSCPYFIFPSNLDLLARKVNNIYDKWMKWVRSKGYCQVSEENQQHTFGSNQVRNPRLAGSSNE